MAQAMKCKVGNPSRKLVLLKLADNANDRGECFPSYQHIADQCEMSKRSVIEHIKKLEAQNLLTISHRKTPKGNSSNLYLLTLSGGENSALGSEISALGSEISAPPPSENSAPRTSHSFESINEPKKTKAKKFTLPGWIDSELWDDWMLVRKKKGAVNSPRAMKSLVANLEEIARAEHDPNMAIDLAITKSWKTVELEYLKNIKGLNHGTHQQTDKQSSYLSELAAIPD